MAKPGEPWWDSPWGRGRPGWHIECSAMAMKHLGETIDIHAGGQDLQFPHHENEIAQSELATGKPFARYWLHVAFLRFGGRRMGKSEQNFILVRDALREYSPEAIRHFLISAQYRHPLDYNDTSLQESSSAIRRLNNCLDDLRQYQDRYQEISLDEAELSEAETALIKSTDAMSNEFEVAMDDDFNTAGAMGAIFKFVGEVNLFLAETETNQSNLGIMVLDNAYHSLTELCGVLGIDSQKTVSRSDHTMLMEQLMELIVDVRQEARKRKDWQMSDKIRDRLTQLNIELKDSRVGTTWKHNDV
jgi:cysteinyl-tRNA synthetase